MKFKQFYTGRVIGSAVLIAIAVAIFTFVKFASPTAPAKLPTGGETIPPATLVDGEAYNGAVFHDSSIVDNKKSYHSNKFDISFEYPADHVLFESAVEGKPQAQNSYVAGSIVLGPDLPMRQSIAQAQAGHGGESPSDMILTFYLKQDKSVSLTQWLQSNPSGNFNPTADPGIERTLVSTTVAGVPALKYHSDLGLYPADYVAFTYGNWFVLASVNTEGNTQNFEAMLSSTQLR